MFRTEDSNFHFLSWYIQLVYYNFADYLGAFYEK